MPRKPGTTLEPVAEAKRQLTFAETMHRRLVERNRKAEQKYLDKIQTLKATHAELQEAEQVATEQKRARHRELVQIRMEVEAGKRRFAHDGELMLLLEENRLAKELGIK